MKILVLCSGGDAPGMNRFVYEIVKAFPNEVFYAKAGFKGLVENKIYPLSLSEMEKVKDLAGAYILSSRYPEFKEEKYFKKAVKNVKDFDVVIIIGGNGSQKGAKQLYDNGMETIFVPGTIDNDVDNSFYSIGFDSAVHQCVYTVENSMPSVNTFFQTCLFEVMGNKSSAICDEVAKRVDADYKIDCVKKLNYNEIVKIILKNKKAEKGTKIIVKEKILPVQDIADGIKNKNSNIDVKCQIVGRLQRGGKPTKTELKFATIFAKETIKNIKNNQFGKKILINENKKAESFDF